MIVVDAIGAILERAAAAARAAAASAPTRAAATGVTTRAAAPSSTACATAGGAATDTAAIGYAPDSDPTTGSATADSASADSARAAARARTARSARCSAVVEAVTAVELATATCGCGRHEQDRGDAAIDRAGRTPAPRPGRFMKNHAGEAIREPRSRSIDIATSGQDWL